MRITTDIQNIKPAGITPKKSMSGASIGTEKGMTADIKQTLALIRTLWRDLPKSKTDLQGSNRVKISVTLVDN